MAGVPFVILQYNHMFYIITSWYTLSSSRQEEENQVHIGNGQKAVKIPSHTQDRQLNNSVLSQCLTRPVSDLPTRTYIGLNLVRNTKHT